MAKSFFANNEVTRKKQENIVEIHLGLEKRCLGNKRQMLEALFGAMLVTMGIDLRDPNFEDTPYRMAKMYHDELFTYILDKDKVKETLKKSCVSFPTGRTESTPVIIKDIDFTSMCSHHFMPFIGKIDIIYYPETKLLGLSKFPRIVKTISKQPTLQEALTDEILSFIKEVTDSDQIFVRVKAKHSCVSARGVEKEIEVVTTAKTPEVDYLKMLELLRG